MITKRKIVHQHPVAGFCRYHKIWLDEQKILLHDCINRDHERQLMGYCQYFEAGETRTCEKLPARPTVRYKKRSKTYWNGGGGECGITSRASDLIRE